MFEIFLKIPLMVFFVCSSVCKAKCNFFENKNSICSYIYLEASCNELIVTHHAVVIQIKFL